MPLTTIGRFEIKHLQIINETGKADEALLPPEPDKLSRDFFERIIFARAFNDRALSLQREGRLGTYASILGQEATQIGSAVAMGKSDWVFPSFRETGVLISLGYPLWRLLKYWAGDERGMHCPEDRRIFPMSVPVGTQLPHAAGVAMAMKIKKKNAAAIAFFGDGGSSRGDFHEALNMSGVYKAPAVFICENNQWAISVPRASQSAVESIAQRAFSYGISGMQVDGNDVFAVYKAVKDALEAAYSGKGPTLIECYTYRLDNHTTSDDASRYRSDDEVMKWRAKEPLIRLRLFMQSIGAWSQGYEDEVTKKALEQVDSAVKEAEALPPPDPADLIKHTSATMTPRQLRELKESGWGS